MIKIIELVGQAFKQQGWAQKLFDPTNWILTIRFPNIEAVNGPASLWPNSPPLPAPLHEMAQDRV